LINRCIKLANSKIGALEQELDTLREATTSERKSPATDKYETG
jgi:hypothetical protein